VNLKRLIGLGLLGSLVSASLYAGNDTKRGQAGAVELLVNPWARSSGMAGANSGIVRGIEAMGLNVAGLNGIKKTEVNFVLPCILSAVRSISILWAWHSG